MAERSTLTNELLVGALHERGVRAQLVKPARLAGLARGDLVLGRLDVRGTLDGVEDGIRELRRVERRGVPVLNPVSSLFACHDKLQTALGLVRLGIPKPATAHVDWNTRPPAAEVTPRLAVTGSVYSLAAVAAVGALLAGRRRHDRLSAAALFALYGLAYLVLVRAS